MPIKITFFEAMMGLLGQHIACDSNLVWVTKTHWPVGSPGDLVFPAEKMMVIARNPIDVYPSFCNLMNTKSHSLEVNERFDTEFPEFWQQWIERCTTAMRDNHSKVLSQVAAKIPTYFMRYEDLKLRPEPVLTELFCFMLDVDSLEGTLCERRIKEITASGFTTKTAYALKSTSTNLSRNRYMYSAEQIAYMQGELADMISFWGYNKGSTCFFYGAEAANPGPTYNQLN